MKVNEFTLDNGLRVILADTNAFPTLTTLLLVGAGSRYENKDNNGIAHFLEHMFFKGSKKYPDSFVISSTVEGLGGMFNAFTAKDHTGYWIKATNEHFEKVIDVLSDMLLNPLLKEEEIGKEKGVIVEEINLYEDMPYRRVSEYFEQLLYDGNALGYDIAGSKQTVKSFDRATFTSYLDSLYHPKNAVLVVAGGLTLGKNFADSVPKRILPVSARLASHTPDLRAAGTPSLFVPPAKFSKYQYYLDIIQKKFANWNGHISAKFENVVENQSGPKIFVKSKKTEQAHFCLGYRAFSFFDKRRYVLSILSTILGGGMSSRLFMEVREKRGLCYYISTGREHYHDVGNIVTQAGVTNDVEKIKEAIETILKEHEKIAHGEIKKEELTKAKELIKGRLLLSFEDSSSVASFFGTKKILEEGMETPEEVIGEIEKVASDDIVNLAKEIFKPEALNFAIVGPFEEKDFTNIFDNVADKII